MNWKVQDGARNIFNPIKLANDCLIGNEFKIFSQTLLRNAYFCHHEMILLAALFDSDFFIRRRAVKMIMDARRRRRRDGDNGRRLFLKPKTINFNPPSYLHMIDLNALEAAGEITEPPLTFNFSDKDLQNCVMGHELNLPEIPCHSQNNERCVQDTSIVAKEFSTYEKRHANLLLTMSSRGKFSKDSKKEDFKK